MSNVFVQSVGHDFEQALRLMELALTDCPDDLWRTDLWPDEAPTAPSPHGGLHGSAPWFLGYHALNTFDYDLAGEFEPPHSSSRTASSSTDPVIRHPIASWRAIYDPWERSQACA